MKVCTKCQKTVCPLDFHKDKNRKDGLSPWCKPCVRINSKNWRQNNLVKDRSNSLNYYYDHKERLLLQRKSQTKRWREENPSLNCSKSASYRARKVKAEPNWLTGVHKAHIKRTYKLAQITSEATGEKYHVDHIVPLKGKNICGLHVPWNLQVIPASVNLAKSNRSQE